MITGVQEGLPFIDLPEVSTASDWCQRWGSGFHSWRHKSEGGFDASCYMVEPISGKEAKDYVLNHHYSKSFSSATKRYGLYRTVPGERRLCGVAVYGTSVGQHVFRLALPELEPIVEALELSRFVLDDSCPGNSESWFIARCHEYLYRDAIRGVISFADPVPRRDLAGKVIFPGHVGTIYKSTNAIYTGRATPRTVKLLPDGTVLNDRAAQKVRRQEQGHDYVEEMLVRMGARVPAAGVKPAEWLWTALQDVGARNLRHRGAHRYVFPLGRTRKERASIKIGPEPERYPRQPDRG